ncbi:MAG: hypothetical protein ABH851_02670 [Methanobacteriota archaeon]
MMANKCSVCGMKMGGFLRRVKESDKEGVCENCRKESLDKKQVKKEKRKKEKFKKAWLYGNR